MDIREGRVITTLEMGIGAKRSSGITVRALFSPSFQLGEGCQEYVYKSLIWINLQTCFQFSVTDGLLMGGFHGLWRSILSGEADYSRGFLRDYLLLSL